MLRPYLRNRIETIRRRLDGLRKARDPDPEAIASAEAIRDHYRAMLNDRWEDRDEDP